MCQSPKLFLMIITKRKWVNFCLLLQNEKIVESECRSVGRPPKKARNKSCQSPLATRRLNVRHASQSSHSCNQIMHCSYMEETMVFVLISLLLSPPPVLWLMGLPCPMGGMAVRAHTALIYSTACFHFRAENFTVNVNNLHVQSCSLSCLFLQMQGLVQSCALVRPP